MDKQKNGILRGALAATLVTLVYASSGEAADGGALYKEKICHTCHGEQPNQPVLAVYPKLGGQNAAYLLQQMKDIRDGRRTNGLSVAMKAVVSSVTDDEFQSIADWLAAQ